MPANDRRYRRPLKWGLIVIISLLLLASLYLTALAFPQIILHNKITAGNIQLYSDNTNQAEISKIAFDAENRIKASGFYDSTKQYHVFYFQNPKSYRFYTTLARLPDPPQGFALSFFGNAYINAARIHELGDLYGNSPSFSIFEGDPAHLIAHELGHLIITGKIGRGRWNALPHWKQEGFPEYIANIAGIKSDSTASLSKRIGILQDDFLWRNEYGWDRIHYKAGLLVEYLLDVKGMTPEDIISDSVKHDVVFFEMIEWGKQASN